MEKPYLPGEPESFPTGVFEIPGEPAVIINGVPPLPPVDDTLVPCIIVKDTELQWAKGFGEWLEGREVQKQFGDRFYKGKVTEFDKDTGWYKVVYEDGDFEDLEWHELEEVILPLDITVPLKSLALKIIKKRQRTALRKTATKSRSYRAKEMGDKGKTMEALEEVLQG